MVPRTREYDEGSFRRRPGTRAGRQLRHRRRDALRARHRRSDRRHQRRGVRDVCPAGVERTADPLRARVRGSGRTDCSSRRRARRRRAMGGPAQGNAPGRGIRGGLLELRRERVGGEGRRRADARAARSLQQPLRSADARLRHGSVAGRADHRVPGRDLSRGVPGRARAVRAARGRPPGDGLHRQRPGALRLLLSGRDSGRCPPCSGDGVFGGQPPGQGHRRGHPGEPAEGGRARVGGPDQAAVHDPGSARPLDRAPDRLQHPRLERPPGSTGGQSPFGNVGVWYTRLGVVDPFVNAGVGRFAAQAGGLRFLSDYYQTRGTLAIPLLTLHTTLDPDVPFFHERAYAKIVAAARTSTWLAQQSVQRYGHRNVTPAEVATTLSRLVSWAENGVKPASGDVTLDLAISSPDSATTSAVAAASAELTFDEAILSATTGLSLP